MAIKTHELEKMNGLLERGSTVSKISRKYPDYGYWKTIGL